MEQETLSSFPITTTFFCLTTEKRPTSFSNKSPFFVTLSFFLKLPQTPPPGKPHCAQFRTTRTGMTRYPQFFFCPFQTTITSVFFHPICPPQSQRFLSWHSNKRSTCNPRPFEPPILTQRETPPPENIAILAPKEGRKIDSKRQ